jgi:hypothetical protein
MVARVTLLPDQGIGVAVLTNHGDNLLPVALTHHVLDLVLGLEERPWNDELLAFWNDVRRSRLAAALAVGGTHDPDARPRLARADYVGTYGSPAYGDTYIEESAEGLLLRYGSLLVGRLAHWHHDTFRITWSDPFMRAILGTGFVAFEFDMAGNPMALTWTGLAGERVRAERRATGQVRR